MTKTAEAENPVAEYANAFELLGGTRIVRHIPDTPVQLHKLLARGLPSRALTTMSGAFTVINGDEWIVKAVSISPRTYARYKLTPAKLLDRDQSDRTWRSAMILAKAIDVFGSRKEAEEWLSTPAMALDKQRPIDLLSTTTGVQLVSDILGRIDYGVYT
ncbi:MAG: antitoxin Xre/MbcA/ParS toxin-binding domain-containing protein [Rhodospirillales bacterium]|jgi:putative toxin-antitoxin system antitoxin component (TIGR02293 family)